MCIYEKTNLQFVYIFTLLTLELIWEKIKGHIFRYSLNLRKKLIWQQHLHCFSFLEEEQRVFICILYIFKRL